MVMILTLLSWEAGTELSKLIATLEVTTFLCTWGVDLKGERGGKRDESVHAHEKLLQSNILLGATVQDQVFAAEFYCMLFYSRKGS